MDTYKDAYLKLFNKVTDAIRLLEFAQASAEELILREVDNSTSPPPQQ